MDTIAHYRITGELGAGGMGVVYRARDTKLERDVAIKVLPEELSRDEERLARFEREARLLAQLNHTNIATLYGFEQADDRQFLVMELVEGETLAERIARGPITVGEALSLFIQIADGLEAAHEKGIVHRDLKPPNIKITPDDHIKILDFGLAKAFRPEENVSAATSQSPTLTKNTALGAIMGTASYMSPEQARGKTVDMRTDIWAFGCCLYEALTGKKAFDGETVTDIIAAVVNKEPDWEALPRQTSRSVRWLLQRCLTRDLKKRLRDIREARILLEEPLMEAADVVAPPTASASGKRWVLALVAALALGFIAGGVFWSSRTPPPAPLVRYAITLPEGDRLEAGYRMVAISPDGSHIVYAANDQLYLRPLDQMEAVPVRGTHNGQAPFFSPDGRWIGFWDMTGLLKKVPVGAGAPITLWGGSSPWGFSWSPDGTILIGQGSSGISRISENGGDPDLLVAVEGEERAADPEMLPDGKTLLFTLRDGPGRGDAKIVAQSLETGARRTLIVGGSEARYAPSGHLVYASEEDLMAVPFDAERIEVTGGAVALAEEILRDSLTGLAHFSFSDRGTLVWVPEQAEEQSELVWVDRTGQMAPLSQRRGIFYHPRLSPDGARLAVGLEGDIWILDIARDTLSPLTTEGGSLAPTWSPDGQWVAFGSTVEGALHRRRADFSGEAELVLEGEYPMFPAAWALDGDSLAFAEVRSGNVSTAIVSFRNGGERHPLLESRFLEADVGFSPDGKWMVYSSDRSGNREVFVQPFEGSGGWMQISTSGGNDPVWSRDGGEIFYTVEQRMMVVEIETEPALRVGAPELLFERPFVRYPTPNHDVTADGERFVMVFPTDASSSVRAQLNVVLNWFQELERLAPAN